MRRVAKWVTFTGSVVAAAVAGTYVERLRNFEPFDFDPYELMVGDDDDAG